MQRLGESVLLASIASYLALAWNRFAPKKAESRPVSSDVEVIRS